MVLPTCSKTHRGSTILSKNKSLSPFYLIYTLFYVSLLLNTRVCISFLQNGIHDSGKTGKGRSLQHSLQHHPGIVRNVAAAQRHQLPRPTLSESGQTQVVLTNKLHHRSRVVNAAIRIPKSSVSLNFCPSGTC